MAVRYRNHLILEKATLNLKSGVWTVRAHIQFNQNGTFHDVLIPCPTHSFTSERDAEKYILKEAKTWVDHRLLHVAKSAGSV
jgi:hypothetical protein